MPGAVAVYERAPTASGEDYIFLPQYQNRITAPKIIQRQFKELMTRAKIEDDQISGMKHTIYSLRHTAICMRIILSEGQVNIFNLAKNAGTSVDQIERFYARNLPLSREWRSICRASAPAISDVNWRTNTGPRQRRARSSRKSF
jgi:hypothetical protein